MEFAFRLAINMKRGKQQHRLSCERNSTKNADKINYLLSDYLFAPRRQHDYGQRATTQHTHTHTKV